jgi:sec-independent protein translocase protein TatB
MLRSDDGNWVERMFDFTSSKLLLLGIVALLVIGPKDLPALLRTLGKYMGVIRRHANEFRAQFDEAMRDSELESLKKEVETIGKETEATIRSAEQSVQTEVDAARASVDTAMDDPAQKFAADANTPADALPVASGGGASGATAPLNGAAHPNEPEPAAAVETAGDVAPVRDKGGA